MGSKGEKKSGLVGEKSHTVHSVNWKLDAMLQKELMMLDTSKRRVEHRIAMDQVVANKRFQVKLHRSKVFHARMKGDTEMLRKLITKDNYDFHTNTSSVDVLNKRRDKDLAKKRVLHRQSQDKMMTFRSTTPATTTVTVDITDLPGSGDKESIPEAVPKIRPMTAIERISSVKHIASKASKLRPFTATEGVTKLTRVRTVMATPTSPPASEHGARNSSQMAIIPEKLEKDKPKEVVINITAAESANHAHEADTESVVGAAHKEEETDCNDTEVSTKATTQCIDEPDNKDNYVVVNKQSVEKPTEETKSTGDDSQSAIDVGVPTKSILRPRTALGIPKRSSTSESSPTDGKTRPRTAVTISEPIDITRGDDDATAKADSASRPRTGRRKSTSKSPKSRRKQSMVSIFTDEKKLTIMDIDDGRRQRANQPSRLQNFVETLDDVKTDPDLIVDYYMARLLEESTISGSQKNVERIRDMPDSDFDKDLAKRSMGNLTTNTITFRDVNRNYTEYKYDPYTPLHPTSMGFNLTPKASTLSGLNRQESILTVNTSAWQDSDSD